MNRVARVFGSSSFRLAAIYAALFGISVLILLGFIYWSTAGYLARQTDETIKVEIQGLAEQYRQSGTPAVAAVVRARIAKDPKGVTVYLLAAPDYRPLVGNIDQWPKAEVGPDGWLGFELTRRSEGKTPHPARARAFRLRGGLHLLVGRDVRELHDMRAVMLRALSWGMAVTLALALAGGAMMSRSMLSRIDSINQTSRDIMTGDLSRRIPTKGTGDDFDQLADSLNSMLDRIQSLMEGVRQISDNIAHDLRTPLTRLRGRLERLSIAESVDAEARELLDGAVADADGLLATFSALLRIAEVESGSRRANFEDVALDELVNDVVELYEPLAQDKEQRFNAVVQGGLTLPGDRNLLFQAVANVLDNAVKYTPAGGTVSVTLSRAPNGAEIAIADTGHGIPEEQRQNVFRRFYRLEAERSAPGNGLGLSLVGAVAKLHQATVRLEDNRPGLKVVLTLPVET